MCRLFSLIANKEVDIKFSMLEASNNLKKQGKDNPHGWGIGWYENGKPKIEKYGESAFYSQRFDELVKEKKSRIFIAHVRYASSGRVHSDRNAHPFQYKNYIFAHNGTINKERIQKLLESPYDKDFTSEPIDSEIYFRFLIQNIEKENDMIKGVSKCVKEIIKDSNGANFILSDGENLYVFKFQRSLYILKRLNPSPLYTCSKETYALIESKKLSGERAVLVATEKLTKDEEWESFFDGEFCIIDKNLEVKRRNLL